MPTCPFAVARLIPPGSSDPRITPRVGILHVDAGNADSLYAYFNGPSGGIESHFHVKKSGVIEQYRDTNYQADANYQANDFAVSIETQGYGEGEWTSEQMASIKRLLVWLNEVHPTIPLRECTDPYGSGIGYHTLFGAPSAWTPVSKSCPGPDRKVQFHNVIVPWLKSGAETAPKGLIMDQDVKAAFVALSSELGEIRTAIGTLRQKEAQRYAKTIKEMRGQGKTSDQILAAIESGDA